MRSQAGSLLDDKQAVDHLPTCHKTKLQQPQIHEGRGVDHISAVFFLSKHLHAMPLFQPKKTNLHEVGTGPPPFRPPTKPSYTHLQYTQHEIVCPTFLAGSIRKCRRPPPQKQMHLTIYLLLHTQTHRRQNTGAARPTHACGKLLFWSTTTPTPAPPHTPGQRRWARACLEHASGAAFFLSSLGPSPETGVVRPKLGPTRTCPRSRFGPPSGPRRSTCSRSRAS